MTTETSETSAGFRPIAVIVGERIGALQRGYLRDGSAAVAALARLRRAAGKPPGSALDVVEHTHAPDFVHRWEDDAPSYAENAAHVAMTLYAVHQQSQRTGMHAAGRRLGMAVRALAPDARPDGPVARRFAALGTADSFAELSHHLRGLVQQMRAAGVPLDYGLLARDLWLWQLPGRASQVRTRWGRDYHFPRTTQKTADQTAPEQEDSAQ